MQTETYLPTTIEIDGAEVPIRILRFDYATRNAFSRDMDKLRVIGQRSAASTMAYPALIACLNACGLARTKFRIARSPTFEVSASSRKLAVSKALMILVSPIETC